MSAALKEAFCLFDRDADGFIPAKEISTVICSLGINPTQAELTQMLQGKENALLSYEDVEKMAGTKFAAVDQEEQLNKAFKSFDRNNDGSVSTTELKHVLLNLGEKLTAEEIDELISLADPKDTGKINVQKFVAVICGKT